MYLLAIETTGQYGSVAIINENSKILAYRESRDSMNHLKDLMPMVDDCLLESKIAKSDLTHVAASIGPGSFTGIRIGVSTARVLSQVLEIPAIPAPTLESFHFKEGFTEPKENEAVSVILNARRGQVYGSLYANGKYVIEPKACMLDDILNAIKENNYSKVVFYGDGIDAYEKIIIASGAPSDAPSGTASEVAPGAPSGAAYGAPSGTDSGADFGAPSEAASGVKYIFVEKESRYQDAKAVARLAVKLASKESLNCDSLKPEYMRQAEAEQKLASGQLPICKQKIDK